MGGWGAGLDPISPSSTCRPTPRTSTVVSSMSTSLRNMPHTPHTPHTTHTARARGAGMGGSMTERAATCGREEAEWGQPGHPLRMSTSPMPPATARSSRSAHMAVTRTKQRLHTPKMPEPSVSFATTGPAFSRFDSDISSSVNISAARQWLASDLGADPGRSDTHTHTLSLSLSLSLTHTHAHTHMYVCMYIHMHTLTVHACK
jgi:hypothetical protein